jgi:malonate transporter
LFMIGGILVGQRVRGMRLDLTAVTFGKLVLHPAVTLAVLWALPIASAPMALAAVAMAAMPLPSLYPALGQRHGIEGFCAAALVTVTVVSFFTINAWLWLLPQVPRP